MNVRYVYMKLFIYLFLQQSFKNRVDIGYAVSEDHLHKHRAMAIIRPLTNFTGEYSCTVQTYTSMDKKSAKLKIIGK